MACKGKIASKKLSKAFEKGSLAVEEFLRAATSGAYKTTLNVTIIFQPPPTTLAHPSTPGGFDEMIDQID